MDNTSWPVFTPESPADQSRQQRLAQEHIYLDDLDPYPLDSQFFALDAYQGANASTFVQATKVEDLGPIQHQYRTSSMKQCQVSYPTYVSQSYACEDAIFDPFLGAPAALDPYVLFPPS